MTGQPDGQSPLDKANQNKDYRRKSDCSGRAFGNTGKNNQHRHQDIAIGVSKDQRHVGCGVSFG